MDNNNTIEGQSAAPAGAAETIISASAAGATSAEPVVDIPKLDVPKAATGAVAAATADAVAPARANRFALLAAAVALAAAFGALAGALGASVLAQPTPAAGTMTAAVPQDNHTGHAAIEQMRTELAALRTSVEAGTRNANAQFGKIAERFDRVERTQTERAAKLTKAVDAVERLERRVELAPAKETTGSVTPVAAAPAQPPPPSTLTGWTVRDVYRGIAIIQGARTGPIEVEAGDTVPFLGRIEAIRRQDGHWVVVTSKGVITATR